MYWLEQDENYKNIYLNQKPKHGTDILFGLFTFLYSLHIT